MANQSTKQLSHSSRHFFAFDSHGTRHMLLVWVVEEPVEGHPGCWVEVRKEVRDVFDFVLRRVDKGRYVHPHTGEAFTSDDPNCL